MSKVRSFGKRNDRRTSKKVHIFDQPVVSPKKVKELIPDWMIKINDFIFDVGRWLFHHKTFVYEKLLTDDIKNGQVSYVPESYGYWILKYNEYSKSRKYLDKIGGLR